MDIDFVSTNTITAKMICGWAFGAACVGVVLTFLLTLAHKRCCERKLRRIDRHS